jgi:hypothetical protein
MCINKCYLTHWIPAIAGMDLVEALSRTLLLDATKRNLYIIEAVEHINGALADVIFKGVCDDS